MVVKDIETEFGNYKQAYNHGYKVNLGYCCTDGYKDVPDEEDWMKCPCCGKKPRVWIYNNGASTACACGENMYDHFSVHSESIMSVHTRCGGFVGEYKRDNLRLNWNEYCTTNVNPCLHEDLRLQDKW